MVSILVPVCNVERYLNRCLSSLRGQFYSDFEVICINDGSTDSSAEIIHRYIRLDDRFGCIDKPNSGYGASMNLGLAAARGEFVAILESDDFFEPDALTTLVLGMHDGVDVVKANFWLYWSVPIERKELFRVVDSREAGKELSPIVDQAIFFRKPSIWSALYRKSFLDENGIRFLETPGASYQDSGFNFKVLASAERVAFIEKPVINYRQDNEKSSVNSSSKAFCICDEYASMEKFIASRPPKIQGELRSIMLRMKLDSYLWNCERLSDELLEEFVKRASREFGEGIDRGEVDLSLFEPSARAELMFLVHHPLKFSRYRTRLLSAGGMGKVAWYLMIGGPLLMARIALFKVFGKSIRRTNAAGGALE